MPASWAYYLLSRHQRLQSQALVNLDSVMVLYQPKFSAVKVLVRTRTGNLLIIGLMLSFLRAHLLIGQRRRHAL